MSSLISVETLMDSRFIQRLRPRLDSRVLHGCVVVAAGDPHQTNFRVERLRLRQNRFELGFKVARQPRAENAQRTEEFGMAETGVNRMPAAHGKPGQGAILR